MIKISLLRYPGGKAKIYPQVSKLIARNSLRNKIYVEPFAGGFGLGLQLMVNRDIKRFIINDLDYHIFAFWVSVFYHTKELIDLIDATDITIEQWHIQKDIYLNYKDYSVIEVGFSTLFLNRTNFSGILEGRPIGGINQLGLYKIDCRFNKQKIIEALKLVGSYRDHVEVYNLDAIDLIQTLQPREDEIFYNFDPPYFVKGKELYLNAFNAKDHASLRDAILNIRTDWIMTYDNVEDITKLYKSLFSIAFDLSYSVRTKRKEKELLITSNPRFAIEFI